MENLFLFIGIIMGVITPVTIIIFRILFKNSLTFKIGLIVAFLLDTISILSFISGAGGDMKIMIWMGPIGSLIVIAGFILIIRNLKKLGELSNTIELFASGDISVKPEKSLLLRKDEIGQVAKALLKLQENQSKTIVNIKRSANELLSASERLSSLSQIMVQSANEQASTTEEISAATEEMFTTISSNTKQADNTNKISENSAKELENSRKVFNEALNLVSDIAKKTNIISDIAFKTNILSLNASIEAAHAGVTGAGFAVVAREVKILAGNVKITSKSISELSKRGQNISKIASGKLEKIIPEIMKSAELVNKIVTSSKEQQKGAELINQSIQQLTKITNENSSSAEEISISSEELSAQAEQMINIIKIFKTNEENHGV